MAPRRVQTLLDLEESETSARSTGRRSGDSRADTDHEWVESALGRPQSARRADEAWHIHFPGGGVQVHGPASKTTFSDLAKLSRQSRQGLGVR